MKCFFLLILILSFQRLTAQVHLDSISHLNYVDLHDTYLNDVWGYTDETGKEYALVGARKGTSIVDVSNPANPQEIFWEPGMESVWRDLKTFGDYAYITTEAENGLLILDLTSLPDASGITAHFYTGPIDDEWQSAHNIYIDENGYAYIFGANRGNGGVIILDIHTNPIAPIEVGSFDTWYCHDGFVRGDTMYLAHINDGIFSIVDISNKANPILLGSHATPSNFAHNIWPNDQGTLVFTTDEVSGAYLTTYDISDLQNIHETDRIQSSPGTGVVPHNVHFKNNYIITSYYADGVTIHDVTRPNNTVEVGSYDTYPGSATNTIGCWGVYPFFASGIIVATDITQGFFVLNPTYQRASYLEGTVTDFSTGNPISGVSVQIQGDNQTEITKSNGTYANGRVDSGTIQVTYSKVAYFPQTVSTSVTTGNVTQLDIQLVPIPPFQLTILVKESGTNLPINDAQVKLTAQLIEHNALSNGLGEISQELYYQETYLVTFGKWGYVSACQNITIDENTGSLTLFLEKGYYDDFSFDFGWTTSSEPTVTNGKWVRETPFVANQISRPDSDAQFDCGTVAFITGNRATFDPDNDDVDKGKVSLYSPIFDLSAYSTPYIHYVRWFYNFYGPFEPFDDSLDIFLSNGISTVKIDSQGSDESTFGKWIPKAFLVSDFLPPTANMQLIVTTSDEDPTVNITEAGFDHFFVSEANQLGLQEQISAKTDVKVYPNPSNDMWYIQSPTPGEWTLISCLGQVIQKGQSSEKMFKIDASALKNGVYLLQTSVGTYQLFKN